VTGYIPNNILVELVDSIWYMGLLFFFFRVRYYTTTEHVCGNRIPFFAAIDDLFFPTTHTNKNYL
jgi:hypothetical protein